MKARAMAYGLVMILVACVLSAGVALAAAIQDPNVTIFGNNAGFLNSGLFVTFIGDSAGFDNSGDDNTFVGDEAGLSNTNGFENTFTGSSAGGSNTEGNFNTFMGAFTGSANTTGTDNTFIGDDAGSSCIDGKENTFVGSLAGLSNIHGDGNVFLGLRAGSSETGSNKLYIDNCFFVDAQLNCTIPLIYGEFDNRIVAINGSLGIGSQTVGFPLTITSDIATAVPAGVGMAMLTGNSNKERMELRSAGPVSGSTQASALLQGKGFGGTIASPSATLLGQRLFGIGGSGHDGADVVIANRALIMFFAGEDWTPTSQGAYVAFETTQNGTTARTEKMRLTGDGRLGIGTTTPTHLIQLSGGAFSDGSVWTDVSSKEYKENIKELTTEEAVKTLVGLNPVKYNYKIDKEDKHVGFIAEDVPDLVASKDRKGLSPMDIVAVLTKVVQAQEQKLEEKSQTAEQQRTTIEVLMEKLSKLEAEVNRLKRKDMTAKAMNQD